MTEALKRGKYSTPEGSSKWEFISTACCALIIFSVGCVAGWTSPTLAILMRPDSPIVVTPTDASTLASMVGLGHLIAPPLIVVINRLGRKVGLVAAGLPMIVGFGLIIAARGTSVLYMARFFCGLSLGLGFCVPLMYIGEIASAKLRGSLGIVFGTMMNSGCLFMFVLAPYLSIRVMACICTSIATIATLSIWFIPESPYFLASRGDFDEAEGALEKLRGKTDVTEELHLIKETISRKDNAAKTGVEEGGKEAQRNVSAFKLLCTVPGNRKALIINALIVSVLQMGGSITIMVYGQLIFDATKSGISGNTCVMVAAILQTVCNVATGFLIDRFGRRPLVLISGGMSSFCLLLVTTYFYLLEYTEIDVTPFKLIGPFALLGVLFGFNIGLMPLQMVIQSETLHNNVKALATCLLGIWGGILASVSIKFYLLLAVVWDFGFCVPFFGFFVIVSIGTILILKLLPETKGKTLLEIQKDLNA